MPRTSPGVGVSRMLWVAAFVAACGGDDPQGDAGGGQADAPEAAEKAPKRELIYASKEKLGPILPTQRPSVSGIDDLFDSPWFVGVADGGTPGADVHVKLGDELVLEVAGTAERDRIDWAYTESDRVVFPWNTTVGSRMGDHKHWSRMRCELGTAQFEGKAICQSYKPGRVAYVVSGWVGAKDVLPGKDAVAALTIEGMLWRPTKGDAEQD